VRSNSKPHTGLLQALLALAALLLLASCTPTVELEAATSTRAAQRPTATTPPPATLAVTRPTPAPADQQAPVTISLSQPSYYTTETVVFTVTNRLETSIYVSSADCHYSGLQRVEDDDLIPLIVYYFNPDPAELFKHRIEPGESFACGWRQEAFQVPSADGAARFRNVNTENGRRLPVPPGEYQVGVSYYRSKEEVGQESKGQALLSPRFTILPAPFREQLVVKLWKREYRLGEPIGYTIRNVGKPREWRGPIYLPGSGCGTAIVERLDGSGAVHQWSAAEEESRNRMEPGHLRMCTLDPQLWTDTASDSISLEPGTYRIGMNYELDAANAGVGKREHQVFSAPFTVTHLLLPAVTVTVGQPHYALGEPVDLTITNSSEAPIYTYDNCGEPPVWWVNDNWINPLVMRITEDWIPAQPLAPGESWSCTWQQESYDTLPQGAEHFGSDRGLAVPPGT
jgi:hypothetical protein